MYTCKTSVMVPPLGTWAESNHRKRLGWGNSAEAPSATSLPTKWWLSKVRLQALDGYCYFQMGPGWLLYHYCTIDHAPSPCWACTIDHPLQSQEAVTAVQSALPHHICDTWRNNINQTNDNPVANCKAPAQSKLDCNNTGSWPGAAPLIEHAQWIKAAHIIYIRLKLPGRIKLSTLGTFW